MRHEPVLQDSLPNAPWCDPAAWRLPGTQPIDPEAWLIRDEAFGGQMALRDHLIAEREGDVHGLLPEARPAADECLDVALATLSKDRGYRLDPDAARRPDGLTVELDRSRPLLTLGRLVQADICLIEPRGDQHVLTGAVLCFPAHWTLHEKLDKPLVPIHAPVARYDDGVARRVQRLFDAIRPDRALWRANAHLYRDPALFTPAREADPPRRCSLENALYVRSERQVLRKLGKTGAVVFTIHTRMVSIESLTDAQRAGLAALG